MEKIEDFPSDFTNLIELAKDNGMMELIPGKQGASGCVYLLIDCSGSMAAGEKLEMAKSGASRFASDAMAKRYLIGLISFESEAAHLSAAAQDLSNFYRQVESMATGGSTNMTDAILLATNNLTDKSGLRVMVIATDGYPDNPESALAAAEAAKKQDIEIITIGTDDADRTFLKKLASSAFLGIKVPSSKFGKAIAVSAKLLLDYRFFKGERK